MTDITPLLDKYYAWLKDKTVWKTIDKWVEITAPYLDRNNDYIQIYLKKMDNGFLLTDDSATISGLKQEGCTLESLRRRELLNLTLKGYGVSIDGDQLQVNATPDDFALRKHSLIQAILAVNDMFYLTKPHVTSLFFEDVKGWLDLSDIRYSEQIFFMGRSGYTRKFDFLITKSSKASERIVKAISNPVRNSADSIIMDWVDTKKERPENSKAYAFINDTERNVSSNVSDALTNYEIKPVFWSERSQYLKEFAA